MKVSELLKKGTVEAIEGASQGICAQSAAIAAQEKVEAQIQNNQELYTTLSRSLLELHNDMREFRKTGQNVDRMIFSMQQGVNKFSADINGRMKVLEENLVKLTELWNSVVQEAETKAEDAVEDGLLE